MNTIVQLHKCDTALPENVQLLNDVRNTEQWTRTLCHVMLFSRTFLQASWLILEGRLKLRSWCIVCSFRLPSFFFRALLTFHHVKLTIGWNGLPMCGSFPV